jgi:hypothetical protein
MHSESTASIVPSTSTTSKTPAATPPASSSRMSASKRSRISTIGRSCPRGSFLNSYWMTRASAWFSACHVAKADTKAWTRSTGSSEARSSACSTASRAAR